MRLNELSLPRYLYHATNEYNAQDIAAGSLRTHRPWYGTDQRVWPDGSTNRRSYWTADPDTATNFHPEEGHPVLLRVPFRLTRAGVNIFQRESGTGDWVSEVSIPSKYISILRDGRWYKLNDPDT